MKDVILKIDVVTVIEKKYGMDMICFDIHNMGIAVPFTGAIPNSVIYVAKGEGVKWVEKNLGVIPRIVQA